MIMPHLLLQKSHCTSKAKDYVAQLERSLKTWTNGDLEGRMIQKQLSSDPSRTPSSDGKSAQQFSKLMLEGKVKAALRLISNQGVLPLNSAVPSHGSTTKSVRDVVQEKHPPAQLLSPSAIGEPSEAVNDPHPVHFERMDGPLIRNTVLCSAGPSGIDTAGWKRLCTSFRSHSSDLYNAIASLAKRICTTFVDPSGLEALVACRLDKCPGEVLRCIIGKAISITLKHDIQKAVGPLQLCAGFEGGCEAAMHAMRQLFCLPEFDASNSESSNSTQKHSSSLSYHHNNTYRVDTSLYINGETILSREGTIQGDPLAMAMYAITTTPLIHHLMTENTKQVWFADDASAVGDLHALRRWWDHLTQLGPKYGYHPNASNTCLIVKEESYAQAQIVFGDSGTKETLRKNTSERKLQPG